MKFDESQHLRDSDGKFSKGNSSHDKLSEAVKKYSDDPEKDMSESRISTNQKPKSSSKAVEVNLDADIQKQFDNATPKERQKIAFRYIMDNLCGQYLAPDGRSVTIERVGADKMPHSYDERKIRMLPKLKDLIDAGKLRGVINIEHKLFAKMAYYDLTVQIQNEQNHARLNVGIRSNGSSTLYDIRPIEEIKNKAMSTFRLLTSEQVSGERTLLIVIIIPQFRKKCQPLKGEYYAT